MDNGIENYQIIVIAGLFVAAIAVALIPPSNWKLYKMNRKKDGK